MSDQTPAPQPLIKPGFSWRHRPVTPSEEWAGKNLPPTPLAQHLISLHALTLHLLACADKDNLPSQAQADALAVTEHHLREIAVHTRPDPFAPDPNRRRGW